jgi:uncharacterized protein YgbK (DUF1537 family)
MSPRRPCEQLNDLRMIGVIADDLTGAAELGGLATRLGLRAEVNLAGASAHNPDVMCLDTDSRACEPNEAGRRAAEAALRLKEAGVTWIYKKVDSVLRGQIIPELEEILAQAGLKMALLAPANPSMGRVIRNGTYFLGGRPVHTTEFARDPAYPRRTSDVLALLGRSKLAVCCRRPESALPAEGIVVAEAESSADVAVWAKRWAPHVLAAGGVEFFGELLKTVQRSSARNREQESKLQSSNSGVEGGIPNSEFKVEKELFVCGSTSESAREFINETIRNETAAVIALPAEIGDGAGFGDSTCTTLAAQAVRAFGKQRRVILQIGLAPVTDPVLAARLSFDLVKLAVAVLRQVTPTRVFAEGGATAVELTRRMGWHSLRVTRELAAGVVGLNAREGSLPELIIKPGSYRWPEAVMVEIAPR